ncbi:hypothetical protein B566_EDAN018321 [Ephemera danica]|nr:hypothetical protein B566_EDAN018321 [Ephemera danica]
MQSESFEKNGTKVFFYAFAGAGISAQLHQTRNRSEIVIGAPGVFDWKGSTIRYRDSRLGGYGDSTQYNELNVVNPEFVGSLPYLGYFGFSVGAGAFFPGNENTYYVAGAPRAAEYRGKVLLYDVPNSQIQSDISVLREFVGTQMGEYFGASICVVDLTGDGLPDLVIGAPGHSLLTVNSDRPQGDEGRIYVFINELISLTQGGFRELGEDSKIMGTQHYGARFGTTIVNIGDINLDGHEDIAVGAPYEDDSRGAVYIYHGRKTGITPKFTQRIAARLLNFAVGAYNSGHAVIFRSHPIITFHGEIKTNVERISFNSTGFKAEACIFYTGNKAPPTINAVVTVNVDIVYKRAYIVTNSTRSTNFTITASLKLGEPLCEKFDVEIKETNQDFSKPIDLQMTADLHDEHVRRKRQGVDFCKFCPVVDPNGQNTITARVPYATGCKNDDVCMTELIVSSKITNTQLPIVIGNANSLDLKVNVKNKGEPAFLSQLFITLPQAVPLIRVPKICAEISTEKGQSLKCEIGNPMPANGEVTLPLQFDLKSLASGTPGFNLEIKATSVGQEGNEKNNMENVTIPLLTSADISITGKSIRAQYPVDWHNKSAKAESITFNHIFEVVNYGPSPIDEAKVTITIPISLSDKDKTNFIKLYKPTALLDGKFVVCSTAGGQYATDDVDVAGHTVDILNEKQENLSRTKRSTSKEIEFDGKIPVNRTLFVNCSQPQSKCITIECHIGPLKSSSNVAHFTFKMKANLPLIEPLMEDKDVVLLATKGTVEILSLPSSIQSDVHRPDEVIIHTMFLGKLPEGKVHSWMLVLAILLGILILLLIILALCKMGFFKRNKKTELEALIHKTQAESDFGEE